MENQKWQWLPEETEGSLAFLERKSKGAVAHRKPAQLEHPWFPVLLFHQRGRSSSSEKLHALKRESLNHIFVLLQAENTEIQPGCLE